LGLVLHFSPGDVATEQHSSIPRVRPRRLSFFILAFAWVVLSLPLFIAQGFYDKLVCSFTLLVPIAATYGWKYEQSLLRDFRVAEATVFQVNRWSRRTRALEYSFRASEGGPLVLGYRVTAGGYKVGMTVPVIYSPSDPKKNSALDDLLFYRVVPEG
jgi:hypothetical protein